MDAEYIGREFITVPSFDIKWKRLGLTDEDKRRLELILLEDPKVSAVIRGSGGVRKMRFSFPNRGKSGSVRVIYVNFEVYEKIFLIDVYQKSEKDNISKAECNDMKQLVEMIELEL